MKELFLFLFAFLSLNSVLNAQDEDEEKNPKPRYTMFSVEGAHIYNSINERHGLQAKFYMWSNLESNFGFETHVYLPKSMQNNLELQLDLNYRKILVDFHPLFFDVLVGPGVRYHLNDTKDWIWTFDGINIGFGVGYRYRKFSYYAMPRITHLNSELQFTTGIKYHFNYDTRRIFNKRYKLKTKKAN